MQVCRIKMVLKHYSLIVCLIWISIAGCSPPNHLEPNHLEFDQSFELGSFLKTYIRELPGQTVQFQILTHQGDAVPFGILSLQWIEGGRMSFQTDPHGVLRMEFEKDILDYEVMVSAESEESKVRVTW